MRKEISDEDNSQEADGGRSFEAVRKNERSDGDNRTKLRSSEEEREISNEDNSKEADGGRNFEAVRKKRRRQQDEA